MKKAFINIASIYGTHSKSIQRLAGKDLALLPIVENGFIISSKGRIESVGTMEKFDPTDIDIIEDLNNTSVFPTYCDSHTHIVFAEPREHEFELKLEGKTYEEIAASGGGILNSAAKLQETSEEELYLSAMNRVREMISMGTGCIEIKSGYGLTQEAELKMLRVIQKIKLHAPIPIVSTYLGAHAIPKNYKENPKSYIEEVIFPTMDIVAKDNLADFVDIFIEKNYYSLEMAHQILDHADIYQLKSKLHVNQLSNMGGVQFGVDRKALSVDHLEEVSTVELDYLKNQDTIATLLPSCSFFLRIPYAPARNMVDAGLAIALASDYNPGSTPSGNMNFVLSLACIYQRLLPAEAFNAATLNGAYALNQSQELGSISVGKIANFFTSSSAQSIASIPYSFGRPIIDDVYIRGEKFKAN